MSEKSFERTDGPTPNGGAYFTARYFDREGSPIHRLKAWYVEIHEYNAQDELIQKHLACLGEPAEEEL